MSTHNASAIMPSVENLQICRNSCNFPSLL